MRLICPSCGAAASADAWQNDAVIREVITAITLLPEPVAVRVLGYLALFRPAGNRGLDWKKAKRLVLEISVLVKKPHVQRDKKPARPVDDKMWADAMRQIVDRPPQKLPLKSHGYLTAMVYDSAEAADKQREKDQIARERAGAYRADDDRRYREPSHILSPEEMRRIREKRMGRKKSESAAAPVLPGAKQGQNG